MPKDENVRQGGLAAMALCQLANRPPKPPWAPDLEYTRLMNETTSALNDRCLAMAEAMSDNGICWADPDDVTAIMAELTEANINDVAWKIADLANWMN